MQKMTRRAALAAIPAMSAAAIPSTARSADTDHELLALGKEFGRRFAVEEAARQVGRSTDQWGEWDVAYEQTQEIVRRIEAIPATTMDGLRVKARCIQWCYGDDPVFHEAGAYTTDMRLAVDIVRSLLIA